MAAAMAPGQRLLLAGATGMVGSAILRRLLAACPGIRVVAPHRHRDGVFLADPRVEYRLGDLCDPAVCARLAADCQAAVLAAATTGGARMQREQPWQQVTGNVVMDVVMLQALHDAGVSRVVYVSTASVYQPFEGAIAEEGLRLDQPPPPSLQGIADAKRYLEALCRFWHDKTGMTVTILRPSNIFGPYARFDPAVSNVIPALVRRAVAGEDPFVVWGSPAVCRDVLWADDFAEAAVRALERVGTGFEVFNLGAGRPTTVGEIAAWALDQAGHRPTTLRFDDAMPTSVAFRLLDCARAARLLDWHPATSPEAGVRALVGWWREHRSHWTR